MGQAIFLGSSTPLIIHNINYPYHAVATGNPNCVLFLDNISPKLAKSLGPLIEDYSHLPNRTNVQFAKVIDRNTLQVEIWERGAGYTLGSGTAACSHRCNSP